MMVLLQVFSSIDTDWQVMLSQETAQNHTLLMAAASAGYPAVVKHLVRLKADLNQETMNVSPSVWPAWSQTTDCSRAAGLKNSADPGIDTCIDSDACTSFLHKPIMEPAADSPGAGIHFGPTRHHVCACRSWRCDRL